MRRISAYVTGALMIGSALTACGGASSSDVTKADYIEAADKICEASSAELDALGTPATEEEFNALVAQAVKIEHEELKALRALDMPKDDGAKLKAMYDEVESATDRIESDPSLLTSSSEDPFAESSKLADDYGFQMCGGE